MKQALKILLWTGSILGGMAGVNLLGLAIFAPAMLSASVGFGIGQELFAQQVLGVLDGQSGILKLASVCVLLTILCQKLLRHLSQSESDELAQRILIAVREDKPAERPYFLYLRAFETTRRLRTPLFLLELSTFGLSRLFNSELEGFVSSAVRKSGPLIALGHPGENFGAGRVGTSDETWMNDLTKLSQRARGILLIPSHRPGTLWEIEHVRKTGLLSRTVFVMPPESRKFSWRSHWSQARQAMGSLGSALPEYEELGMMFTLDPPNVRGVEAFSLWFRAALRKSILRLLEQKEPRTDVATAIRKAQRKAGRWRLFGRLNILIRAGAMGFFALPLVLGGHAAPQSRLPWPVFWNRFMNAAEVERQEQTVLIRFVTSPIYARLAVGLSVRQEDALRADLTHAGFRRLSDDRLRSAYRSLSQLLDRSKTETCAAIARGGLSADEMERALLKVDRELVTDWLDVNLEAAIAELDEKPIPEASFTKLIEARDKFEKSLNAEELKRFRELSTRRTARSTEEECWLARKSYAGVSSLPQPQNLGWARVLEFEHETPVIRAPVTNPIERLKALPAFQERARGLQEQQATELFGELVDKGTARLEDSVLLARYGALSEVMETANEATCEAIAGGTAQAGVMEALLGKISDGAQASFLDSQYRAAKAELQQVKPLVLSKDETAIARERFLVTFDDKDLARLQREVRPNSGAARDRSCWMARKDLAAVKLLDEPYKRMWARTLNQQ